MTWKEEIRKKETDLPEGIQEAIDKVAEEMERALQGIDNELILSLMSRRGGKMYKDKNELVDSVVQRSIKELKDNYSRYEFDVEKPYEGTPARRPTPVDD